MAFLQAKEPVIPVPVVHSSPSLFGTFSFICLISMIMLFMNVIQKISNIEIYPPEKNRNNEI